jgi:hypothetical protein
MASITEFKPSIVSDSLMRSDTPVKSFRFDKLPTDVFSYIIGYVDQASLYRNVLLVSRQFYNMINSQSVLNRRLMVLNKSMYYNYGSNLMIDTYEVKEFNQFLLQSVRNHQQTLAFINELLSTLSNGSDKGSPFYVGGSLAVIMANMLQGKEIDMTQYDDSDIDIYCIGNHNLQLIQKIILKLISSCFGHISHYVVLKRFIIDIVFEDPIARKIQIILHVKSSIDEHMEFVDLPITQILLGGSTLNRYIYKTKMAQYALDRKLNIMTDPINEQTNNRIVKYTNRGYTTVVHAIGQQVSLGNPNSKIISIFDNQYNRYYVDMSLSDVIDSLDIIATPELYAAIPQQLPANNEQIILNSKQKQITKSIIFKGVANTQMFKVLTHRNALLKFVSVKDVESIKYRTRVVYHSVRYRCYRRRHRYHGSDSDYDSYSEDEEYDTVMEEYSCLSNITETKFGLSAIVKYKYKHNEATDTFVNLRRKSMLHNQTETKSQQYPFYVPMDISSVPKLSESIFFSKFNDYFLSKNFCASSTNGLFENIKFVHKSDSKSDNKSNNKFIKLSSFDKIIQHFKNKEFDEKQLKEIIETVDDSILLKELYDTRYCRKQMAHTYAKEKQQMAKNRQQREKQENSKGLYGYKTKSNKSKMKIDIKFG